LQLELPAGPAAPTDQAQLINRFMAQVPATARARALVDRVALAGTRSIRCSDVVASSAIAPFEKPDVIVEAPTGLYSRRGGEYLATAACALSFQLPITLDTGAPPLKDAALDSHARRRRARAGAEGCLRGRHRATRRSLCRAMSSPVAPGSPFLRCC